MSRPCWSRSTTSLPGLPGEERLVEAPRARVSPVPSPPTSPISDPASAPAGYWRADSGTKPMPAKLELLHLRRPRRRSTRRARYSELEVPVAEPRPQQAARSRASTGASSAAYAMGSDDFVRVGVHRRQLDRHREVAPVAVEDRAALRGQRHGVHGLAQRREPVPVAAQHLELRDPEPRARRTRRAPARCTPRAAWPDARPLGAGATERRRGIAAPCGPPGVATRRPAAPARRVASGRAPAAALTARCRQGPGTGSGAVRAGRRSRRTAAPTAGAAASRSAGATMPSSRRRLATASGDEASATLARRSPYSRCCVASSVSSLSS